MRIAIHDADAEHLGGIDKFPNYALMKISAYHKSIGDTVELLDKAEHKRQSITNLRDAGSERLHVIRDALCAS